MTTIVTGWITIINGREYIFEQYRNDMCQCISLLLFMYTIISYSFALCFILNSIQTLQVKIKIILRQILTLIEKQDLGI